MPENNGLHNGILHILQTSGAIQRTEIRSALGDEHGLDQISVALTYLKNAGLVERANNNCWRLTDAGHSEVRLAEKTGTALVVPAAATPPLDALDGDEPDDTGAATPAPSAAPQRPARRGVFVPDAGVTKILERFAKAAQDALDEYVYSVGDRRILDRLMAARDAARDALAAHQGGAA